MFKTKCLRNISSSHTQTFDFNLLNMVRRQNLNDIFWLIHTLIKRLKDTTKLSANFLYYLRFISRDYCNCIRCIYFELLFFLLRIWECCLFELYTHTYIYVYIYIYIYIYILFLYYTLFMFWFLMITFYNFCYIFTLHHFPAIC